MYQNKIVEFHNPGPSLTDHGHIKQGLGPEDILSKK